MQDLIKIPTKIVPYAEVNELLDFLIESKQAYDEVIDKKLESKLTEESKELMIEGAGTDDFKIKFPHTIVLFDDAMSIFRNKNNPLFQKLLKNRQPRITYFLFLQDIS
ncbi:MAG: hypothetical protein EZS28_044356, partial [Streblomastix strix]